MQTVIIVAFAGHWLTLDVLGLLKYCKLQQHLQSQVLFHNFLSASFSNKDSTIAKIQYPLRDDSSSCFNMFFKPQSDKDPVLGRKVMSYESYVILSACDLRTPCTLLLPRSSSSCFTGAAQSTEDPRPRKFQPPLECVKDQGPKG